MRQIDTTLISDKVVAELRREILYGTLKPHQELYQDKIANALGVSRMPVREALQVLANDGFVTVRPNKVATVNEVSEKFIRDFYDIRILLETSAIRMACTAKPDCSPGWEAYYAGEQMIAAGDFDGYNLQNGAIHRFIWQATDNFKLQQLLRQMWHTMEIGQQPTETATRSNQEHRLLLDCIEQNDPERAEQAMRQHIEGSYRRILELLGHQKA